MAGAVRPKRNADAVKAAIKNRPPALDEGDRIEYGNTVEIKTRNGSFWPKVAVSSTIRPGETPDEAMERIVEFVTEHIQAQVAELK